LELAKIASRKERIPFRLPLPHSSIVQKTRTSSLFLFRIKWKTTACDDLTTRLDDSSLRSSGQSPPEPGFSETGSYAGAGRSFHIVVVEVFDKKMSERMRITQYYLDEGRSISEDNINERCSECLGCI